MALKETGLGRGLDSLLGSGVYSDEQPGSLATLPISQIQPGLKQPRKKFDAESITELADSIREHGLIQPLTVRLLSSGYYQIIAGERRWRAAKEANLTEVPVNIIEADDKKVMELGLIENLQREDLNPMEEANGYKVLMDEYGMTQEEVAQRMGKSRPAVANALRLLNLPDAVRFLLEEGQLSAGHAKAILAAPDGECQKKLAQKVVSDGLSVRETEALAKRMSKAAAKTEEEETPQAAQDPKEDFDLYYKDLSQQLSQQFGRKVAFQPGKKKNLLTIEYYDLDDLDDLLRRLKGGEAQ